MGVASPACPLCQAAKARVVNSRSWRNLRLQLGGDTALVSRADPGETPPFTIGSGV